MLHKALFLLSYRNTCGKWGNEKIHGNTCTMPVIQNLSSLGMGHGEA